VALCAVQAVLGLDMTICNAALPTVQRALGFSGDGLAWVVDGYSLAYGGLLLAGGRVADLAGPRSVLAAGTALFAAASGCAGLAGAPQVLVAARIAQGAGAALAAPAALSLVTRIAPAGKVHKVLAGYAAAGGAGAAVGQLAGGVIISAAGWRWVLLVNVPAGLLLAAVALSAVPAVPQAGRRGRLDVPGTLAGTGALLCLVFGVLRAGDDGWSDHRALAALVAAGALAVAFTGTQALSADPLVPGGLLRGRERLAGFLTGLLAYAWMYPVLYMLTQVMQDVHGWSALRAGVYWLPTGAGTVAGGLAAARPAVRRVPAPALLAGCALVLCAASLWLARLTPASGYLAGMLPAFALAGVALGAMLAANMPRAAAGGGASAGVAAGLLGTCQQVGAAVSLAAVAAVASGAAQRAVTAWAAVHRAAPPGPVLASAAMHGFSVALTVTAAIAAAAAAAQILPWRQSGAS
jgi:predicted MFS family arabinose efflux permease